MSEDDGQDGITERVAAILAADAVGYSRLMANDEKATIAALDRARAVFIEHVEANRGRVVDTAGDSVLAVFETTGGAVRASLAIREDLAALNENVPEARRMRFRIGIHLGDIHEKADGTVYGDGVNVAARLEALCEPGSVTISDAVRGSVRDRLDVGFADLGEHEGKNLSEPVRAYRLLPEGVAAAVKPKRTRLLALAGAVAAAAVVAAVALWPSPEPPPPAEVATVEPKDSIIPLPTGPSIAVVPFDNLSGNPDQDYFSDGITEDVLVALSRFRSLFVIGKDSTIRYKGTQASAKDIGRDLGVAFVLKGSVQRTDDVIRISTQLLSAEDGSIVWSDKFDRPLSAESLFAIQDEITGQVVATLAGTFGILDQARYEDSSGAHSESLVSYECVLRAKKFYFTWSVDMFLDARSCLEGVIETEPDYADAWAWLALLVQEEYSNGFPAQPDAYERSRAYAQRAIAIAPNNQIAWVAMVEDYFFRREIDEFVLAAHRVIALNPNESFFVGAVGLYLCHAGMCERGLALLDRAKQLSPHHIWWMHLGPARHHFNRGEYEDALAAMSKMGVPYTWKLVMRPAALAHLGRLDEAREALDQLREIAPDYPEVMRQDLTLYHWSEAQIDEVEDGLRKAGLFDEPEAPSRPVIAVLPFDNLSGDPSQEYFADGITEDIITRLAQYPDILVLGRNTTFQFKGEAVDIATIAEKLGADYVIEGSIRRAGETVRVNAQLVGAESGGHIWAETYDRTLDPVNLFAMQDEITEAVASRIGDPHGVIGRAEFQRSTRNAPKSLSSYECVLRYSAHLRNFNQETHRVARDCLEAVVETESGYGEALAFLGSTYITEAAFGWNASAESSLQRALDVIERGVAVAPESGRVRVLFARALYLTDKPERAIREAEEALRIDPNNVEVLAWAGDVFASTGTFNRAEEVMEKVALMNPNYPVWMNWLLVKVHMARGEYLEAIARLQKTQMEWWYWTKVDIAACYCLLGDIERGRKELEAALEANPNFAEVYWRESYYWNKGPKVRPFLDAATNGLEACGWDVPPDPGPEAFAAPQ